MKIKTITCQHVYNYGASLQAYALQHYLEGLGNDVKIIRFIPWYHHRYEIFYIGKNSKYYNITRNNPILKIVYCLLKNSHQLITWKRKASFDNFDELFLKLTEKKYETSSAIKKDPPEADLFIAGSDQIWNTDCPNGHEPAYYLDFGSHAYKVSYAASFGISEIANDSKDSVRSFISKLDRVSVRESSGLKILENLGFENVTKVVDPVFLLNQKEWIALSRRARKYNIKNRYLFLYNFIDDPRIRNFTTYVAKKLQLKIVSVNDFKKIDYADYNINDAGPLEFINLLAGAELVIGNSFHATAFSVIFHKSFFSFSLASQKNSSRMTDFLKQLDLSSRFNPDTYIDSLIRYDQVQEKLNIEIDKSKKYLNDVLESAVRRNAV